MSQERWPVDPGYSAFLKQVESFMKQTETKKWTDKIPLYFKRKAA